MVLREIEREARRMVKWHVKHFEPYIPPPEDIFAEEDLYASEFIGTVFHLTPSGKYYLPFACSNVDLCPRCKGKGCDFCGHLGSREAWEDEVWNEAVQEAADKLGYWLQSGEGDPCDIFLCRHLTQEEADTYYKGTEWYDYI